MAKLGDRVGRIISGSINAMIDAIENAAPEAVMEQALREIDDAIAEVRVSYGKITADKHLASKQLTENSNKHEELTSQVEVAIAENRDDLAEAAIARQMDLEAQVPILEASVKDYSEREQELEGYIKALKGKRSEMLQELDDYKKHQAAAAQNQILDGDNQPNPNSDVNAKVEAATRVFERVAGSLPSGDALDETSVKLAELEELSKKNAIQERLKAIKDKQA
ncbi:PspA/IM30 family protein [Kordiimonas sp. SCSIO 12610]|uniref:PspA/IM30 family protein n=1 Tax=Kordiimonas sp. SCSIO 12610 TaxID=2829597 RepID=UPI00210E3623|nr:PspA/IM30 family protein [Kordiimonas sp. SCSIO 12610]UTW54774.1 PspA/IM30 family protein [Kordiimonas sp. SCSIO 12610]